MFRPVAVLLGIGLLWVVDSAAAQKPRIERNPKDGAEMILIPDGTFQMGTNEDEIDDQFRRFGFQSDWKKHALDEMPRHRKSVKAFFIYRDEVTNAQYQKFIVAIGQDPPAHWRGNEFPKDQANHPVVNINWEDAQAYCRWAGTRLVTEAEWEYAARGAEPKQGDPVRIFPWGVDWNRGLANSASYHAGKELIDAAGWKTWYASYDEQRFPLTKPVGSFAKTTSPFGVHDLAGNAWEWVADVYQPHSDRNQKKDSSETRRVVKGGSWANVAFHLRCADRQPFAPKTRNLYIGFRCAKDR
jgi:formylglycine-generating enzyme required for sulfatase activity